MANFLRKDLFRNYAYSLTEIYTHNTQITVKKFSKELITDFTSHERCAT